MYIYIYIHMKAWNSGSFIPANFTTRGWMECNGLIECDIAMQSTHMFLVASN
jgi:hypothetical protein